MNTATKTNQSALIKNTNIPAKLVRAVVRQFGGWESFTQSAPDVTSHGIDGGFHGFIYTRDTQAFAKRNRAEIAKLASEQADDFGTGVIEMIRGFGCFRNSTVTDEEIGSALFAGRNAEDGQDVLNALAWYAGEEVCRAYCDLTENN